MDKTNRIIRICRRIAAIESEMDSNETSGVEFFRLAGELQLLESELKAITVELEEGDRHGI